MKKILCCLGAALLIQHTGWSQFNEKDTIITTVLAKQGSVFVEADVLPDYIQLNWSKGPDDFIGYFELYRSADGIAYNIVKQFHPRSPDAPQNEFSYRDENPLKGKNYYRLVGYDRFTQESRTVEFIADYKNQPRKLQPTLVSKGKELNILNYDGEEMQLMVYSTSGAPVLRKVVAGSVVNISSDNLAAGLYVYQLVNRRMTVVSSGKIVLQ